MTYYYVKHNKIACIIPMFIELFIVDVVQKDY